MFYGKFTQKQETYDEFLSTVNKLKNYFHNISAADNLITCDRNFSFSLDEKFNQAITNNAEHAAEASIFWRIHVLVCYAMHVKSFVGDFVECGVYHGFSSKVICDYLNFGSLNRQYYLYDTFEGLPESTSTEREREIWNPTYQHESNAGLYEKVCKRFAPFPNVRVIKGTVPESFGIAMPDKIAFLHIDMNSVKPEMAALEMLYDRVVPGGVIILDDYGWLGHHEQMNAEREFFLARGKMVMELPTGQGVVMI